MLISCPTSSDGPQYVSQEMTTFSMEYGFKQITSSPHYLKSNGLAERTVQIIKMMLEKSTDPHLALLSHRGTALQWCGLRPPELLMGRRIRTMVPQVTQHFIPKWPFLKIFRQLDKKYKSKQKKNYDRSHRARSLPDLADDTPVWVRTDDSQQRGKIVSTSNEPRSYIVSTPTGQVRRNRQHIVPRPSQTNLPECNEFQQSPVQTRSQIGTMISPPDRLTY